MNAPPTRPYVPLAARAIAASRLPPWLAALAIFLAVQLVFLVWMNGVGEVQGTTYRGGPIFRMRFFWFETLAGALLALGCRALGSGPVVAAQRLVELAPLLDGERPSLAYPRRAMRSVALAGVLLGVGFSLWSAHAMSVRGAPWPMAVLLWVALRNALVFGVIGQCIALDVHLGRLFARLGRAVKHVELFDPAARAPFGWQALQAAMLWVSLASINAFFLFDDIMVAWTLTFLIGLLGVAAASLWLPMSGIRGRVRAEKTAEAARVRQALARERTGAALERSDTILRLAAFVGYLGQVESVREWPFDAPALARLSVYLALPIGSWLGGALVERGVGWFLG